jgi:telomere length regulation protein
MDIADSIVKQLKSNPNQHDIELLIAQIPKRNPPVIVISAILSYTIPQTYTLLPPSIQSQLISILLSYIGLSNVVSRLQYVTHIDHAKLWLDVVKKILYQDEFLLHIVDQVENDRMVIKEVDKLLFKGKLVSAVNQVSLQFELDDPIPDFFQWLCSSLLSLYHHQISISTINIFLNSLLRSNPVLTPQYFEFMINQQNLPYFIQSYKELKSFQQNDIALKLLTIHINKVISDENILAWSNVLRFIELKDHIQCKAIIKQMNRNLNVLACILISDNKRNIIFTNLLEEWSNQKSTPISVQEHTTHLLIQILPTTSPDFSHKLTSQPTFLTSISNHLEAFSTHSKALGVILANRICENNHQPPIFNMELDLPEYDYLIQQKPTIFLEIPEDECWKDINQPIIEEVEDIERSVVDTSQKLDKLNFSTADSDDETDEEDDPMAHRSSIPKPLYIKDLLEYLNIDSKNERAYDMLLIALKSGPTLIRQKSINSNEVKFYSEELITILIGMGNEFKIDNFTNLQLLNIIAVLVATPNAAIHLYKLLLTGDYSLQQRMVMLSASSLACRELRGFHDEVVANSFTPANFATSILPKKLNFYSQGMETIERSIQNDLMEDRSQDARDKLIGGKILRVSERLKKTSLPVDKPIIPDFYKLVGKNFYFPLVSVWYESNGIDIGHYSPILISHFIKTLTLILHTGYPSAVNINDMIKEFLLIVTSVLSTLEADQVQTIESISTGVLLICDITDGQFLIDNFTTELQIVQTWMSKNWENIIDNRVVGLCSGLLLRLQEMNDSYERSLIHQMNSFY